MEPHDCLTGWASEAFRGKPGSALQSGTGGMRPLTPASSRAASHPGEGKPLCHHCHKHRRVLDWKVRMNFRLGTSGGVPAGPVLWVWGHAVERDAGLRIRAPGLGCNAV